MAEENWLETLFGPQPEAPPAVMPRLKAIDPEQVRAIISGEIARVEMSRHEWAAKEYKSNPKQIHLRGDGPSRYETMSISQINESRRRKAVEGLEGALESLRSMEEMLSSDVGQKRFEGLVEAAIEAALFPRAGDPFGPGQNLLDRFEVFFLDRVGYKHGSASSTPLSRLVRELVVFDAADQEEEATKASDFPRQR